jgi:acetate kinase
MDAGELGDALEHESGLAGIAGTGDMREVVARAGDGDEDAELAIEVYVHRLCGQIAAMAAAIDGLDVLAFTGGVGERSDEIRQRAAARLGLLGIELDRERNRSASPDAEVGADGAAVRVVVIRAREDLEMVRLARPLLA